MNQDLRRMAEEKFDAFLSQYSDEEQERILRYALDHFLPKYKGRSPAIAAALVKLTEEQEPVNEWMQLKVDDRRQDKDGAWWSCTDPDIGRWVSNGPDGKWLAPGASPSPAPAVPDVNFASTTMALVEDYAKAVHDGDDAACLVLRQTIQASLEQPAVPDAEKPETQGERDAKELAYFERLAHRMGELWERCQGKGWPDAESEEFTRLRDVTMPKLRAALLSAGPARVEPLSEEGGHAD